MQPQSPRFVTTTAGGGGGNNPKKSPRGTATAFGGGGGAHRSTSVAGAAAMMKEPLGMYWVRKTRASSGSIGNILQHTERLHHEVVQAIRCGQDSIIAFQLRLSVDDELRYEAFMTFVKDKLLWFPLVPGETDPPADSLFKPSVDAGYTLHGRFRPLLLWIVGQGLAYKLKSEKCIGIFSLVVYWSPDTIRPMCDDETLVKYYLTSRLAITEEKQILHFRSVIKNAMDAGQCTASLCILYKGKEGYTTSGCEAAAGNNKCAADNNDATTAGGGGGVNLRYLCKDAKHFLTNAPVAEGMEYMINEKYEPILQMVVDKEKLQWTLRSINEETMILTAVWM